MASSRLERIGTIFTRQLGFLICFYNMSNAKKSVKSNFLGEDLSDFINKSQFVKEPVQGKKSQKRNKSAPVEEEGVSKLIVNYEPGAKKMRHSVDTAQKVRDTIVQQIESRKQCNDLMLNNLSDILTQFDADYTVMIENEQKLESLTGAFLKCIQQASAAHKQNLKSLWDIHAAFQKRCEEINTLHQTQNEKLAEEIGEDIKNLEQKLITETKRNGWENLRKTFFHAMQNDM